MKRFIALTNILVLVLIFALPSYAVAYTGQLSYEDFVTTEIQEDSIYKTIEKENLNTIKSKSKGLSQTMLAEKLLVAIGMQEWAEDDTIVNNVANSIGDMQNIRLKIQYLSLDKDSGVKILTEEECLNEIKEDEKISTNDHSAEKTDGKMKSSLLVSYTGKKTISGQANTPTYFVLATHEWLSGPAVRVKDAFSLYADSEALPFGEADYHTGVLRCTRKYNGGSNDIEELLPAEIISGGGVRSVCYLSPYISGSGTFFSDFSCLLISNYFITDTNPSSKVFRLWSKYVHSWLGISLSVGWDVASSSPGVTLSPALQTTSYSVFIDIATGTDY